MLLEQIIQEIQNLTNRKVTQTDIAEALNVTKQAINNKKNSNYEFQNYEVKKIKEYILNKYSEHELALIDDCIDLPVRGNLSASMGTGIQVYNESQTSIYKISAKVLKDIGANPKESDIIFAEGDSMEPTIQGGSALIVDKSRTDVKDGKIYCINFNGALMAKRLQLLPPKKLRVISDNFNKYPAWDVDFSKEIDFNFKVVGEVMRWMTNAR